MNWSARGNVLNQYLRNTSIGTTVSCCISIAIHCAGIENLPHEIYSSKNHLRPIPFIYAKFFLAFLFRFGENSVRTLCGIQIFCGEEHIGVRLQKMLLSK